MVAMRLDQRSRKTLESKLLQVDSFELVLRRSIEPARRNIKGCPFFRLLRNEGDNRDESDVPIAEHRSLFLEANSRHRRWERIRCPAWLHAACDRRECSACASDCRRLRPS